MYTFSEFQGFRILSLLPQHYHFRNINPYTWVVIPAMQISMDFKLKENLQNLGIKNAFENSCDLSGMISEPSKLQQIIHKAVIKVIHYSNPPPTGVATSVVGAPTFSVFGFRCTETFGFRVAQIQPEINRKSTTLVATTPTRSHRSWSFWNRITLTPTETKSKLQKSWLPCWWIRNRS